MFNDFRKIRGVALVIHGLNLNPPRMEAVISQLLEMNVMVLNLALRGHGSNFTPLQGWSEEEARMESFKQVTFDGWMQDAVEAYDLVQLQSEKLGVPIILAGYSIGALVGLNAVLTGNIPKPNRAIFFAPAIALYWRSFLIKPFRFFPKLVIPSWSPDFYRSSYGTPVAAYLALYEGVSRFRSLKKVTLDFPTLVFIDRNDELVSVKGLKKMIRVEGPDSWKVIELENRKAVYHHLIIDEASIGENNWRIIIEEMKSHLL